MSSDFPNDSHLNGSQNRNGSYGGEWSNGNLNAKNIEEDDEIDIKQILSLILRYKWVIIGSVLVTTVLAGIYAFHKTPVYESSGTLIISNNNTYSNANSDLSSLVTNMYGIGVGNKILDEIQVLQSRTLAKDIAKKLEKNIYMPNGRIYPLLWRAFPEDSSITTADTVAQRIEKNLKISQINQQSDAISITFDSFSPIEAAKIVDLTMSTYSTLSTDQNRYVAGSALVFLKHERNRIKSKLDSAEVALQNFMNHKKLVDLDDQTQQLIQTITQLQQQREQVEVQRVAANASIKEYNAQMDSLRPGLPRQYAEALAPTLTRYQYQLAELQTKRMLLLSKNPSLKKDPDSLPEYQDLSDQISMLRQQIKKMTAQLVNKSNDQFLGFLGNPSGGIAQQVVTLNQNLIQAEIQKKQYDAQAKVLDGQLAKLNTFFDNLPDNMIQLARLKRNVSINEQLYLTVAQQTAQMALWQQTQAGLGRIVDHGYIPNKPIKPKKKLYVLIGFILGLVLSVGGVFIKETFTTEITSAEDIKKKKVPVLAVIPDMTEIKKKEFKNKGFISVKGKNISTEMITLLDSISPIAESFRRLQSNIVYSQPDHPVHTLLITSANKGEGKTTLIGNLAVSLAESGKKVLIVDCDLRRPRVHKLFDLKLTPGIVEVLFEDIEVDEVIQSTIISNVNILTTGKHPPNPETIIRSEKLMQLIQSLKTKYDYVLIDTPPYGIITDAAPLIQLVDGVMITVRFNKSKEPELEHVLENLHNIKANIIGCALIGYDYSKSSDYYYTSGYYKEAYKTYYSYHNKTM